MNNEEFIESLWNRPLTGLNHINLNRKDTMEFKPKKKFKWFDKITDFILLDNHPEIRRIHGSNKRYV